MSSPSQPLADDSNPYAPIVAGERPSQSPQPWRVWPLFAVCVLELLFVVALQAAAALALLFATREEGQTLPEAASELPSKLMEAPMFVATLVLSSGSMILVGLVAGWLSSRNRGITLHERLGLRWPSVSTTNWIAFLLGSVPVLLLAVGVVILIEKVIPGDESALMLYQNISNGWAIIMIIAIGVLPGFGEELFFRGFFQRRLLQRYRPAVAIGITSFVFGLFHVTPHGIALATIMGVWLGVLAWRTNSIWPSAFCHAFVNSGWNVYQVGRFQWGIPDIPPMWFLLIGGVIVLAALAWSLRILVKTSIRAATG